MTNREQIGRFIRRIASSDGSVSIQTVALLLLIATIGFGCMALISTAGKSIQHAQDEAKEALLLSKAIEYAIAQLEKNPSIEADSPLDPAYDLAPYNGVSIVIRDISSLINPNWVRKGIITDTNLINLMLPGQSADKLQQYREDSGFSLDISDHYKDFFSTEALSTYIGSYSYANINSSDEFSLRKLYAEVTNDKNGSEFFHNKVTQQLRELKIMNENELVNMLGISGSDLRKVLTTKGQINVNFVDPYILDCLLSYKPYNIGGSKGVLANIVAERKAEEIDDVRLRTLLGGIAENHPILGYLGARTWFWRISASFGTTKRVVIVARQLPFDDLAKDEKIRIIEVVKNEG